MQALLSTHWAKTEGYFVDQLQNAIKELYFWKRNLAATNFTAQLYSLMQKADVRNYHRLRQVFPFEAQALELWQSSEDEDTFFEQHLDF